MRFPQGMIVRKCERAKGDMMADSIKADTIAVCVWVDAMVDCAKADAIVDCARVDAIVVWGTLRGRTAIKEQRRQNCKWEICKEGNVKVEEY